MKEDIKFGLYEIVWMDVDGEFRIGIVHDKKIYEALSGAIRNMVVADNSYCAEIDGEAYPIFSGADGIRKASELLMKPLGGIKEYMSKRKFQKLYNKNMLNLEELKEYNKLLLELDNYGKVDNSLNVGQQKNSRRQAKMKIEQAKREMEESRKLKEREEFIDELFKD